MDLHEGALEGGLQGVRVSVKASKRIVQVRVVLLVLIGQQDELEVLMNRSLKGLLYLSGVLIHVVPEVGEYLLLLDVGKQLAGSGVDEVRQLQTEVRIGRVDEHDGRLFVFGIDVQHVEVVIHLIVDLVFESIEE